VPDILIRDQILVGTRYQDVRQDALRHNWQLKDLLEKGRSIEASKSNAKTIFKEEEGSSCMVGDVNRINKPGKYSKKINQRKNMSAKPHQNKHEEQDKLKSSDL